MACKATFVGRMRQAGRLAGLCGALFSYLPLVPGLRHVALRPGEVGFGGLELGGGVVVALLERFEEFLRRQSVLFLTLDIRPAAQYFGTGRN